MPEMQYDVHGPRVLRLSCFVENRLGALQAMLRALEDAGVQAKDADLQRKLPS